MSWIDAVRKKVRQQTSQAGRDPRRVQLPDDWQYNRTERRQRGFRGPLIRLVQAGIFRDDRTLA